MSEILNIYFLTMTLKISTTKNKLNRGFILLINIFIISK